MSFLEKQKALSEIAFHNKRRPSLPTSIDFNDIENKPNNNQNEDSKSLSNLLSRSSVSSEVTWTSLSDEWIYEEGSSTRSGVKTDIYESRWSTGNEGDYGEPPRYQHLQFDFTPIQGVDDDEEMIQKCVSFWKFVNSRPEFNEILVKPEEDDEETTQKEEEMEVTPVKTALQWTADLPLGYLGKLSLQYCAEPPPHYKHSSDKTSATSGGSATRFWVKGKKDIIVERPTYDEEQTKKLIAAMEEFDEKHPRCFEPPRTIARSLITAEMKRLPPLSYPTLYPN